jgi:hypothetical protein
MTKSLVLALSVLVGGVLCADELHEPMEKVGKAAGALRKAIPAGDMKVVSENAGILAEVLPTTVAAWEKRSMTDAVGWTKEGAVYAADLKKAADANDADGVRTAMSKLGGTCKSCHTAHREEIPDTNPKKYKIK